VVTQEGPRFCNDIVIVAGGVRLRMERSVKIYRDQSVDCHGRPQRHTVWSALKQKSSFPEQDVAKAV
jgi:hypothetical protein